MFRQEQALSACFWNLLSRFQVLGLSGYLLETEMCAFSPFLNCVCLFTYLFIYLLTFIYLFRPFFFLVLAAVVAFGGCLFIRGGEVIRFFCWFVA